MITSGELQRMIEEDGVSGVTSNPSIFEKAITGGDDYDESIRALTSNGSSSAETFQALAIDDIQRVADLLRSTYDRTDGREGFVSLEVSPTLAHDTTGTITEARELWTRVNRPNVMIKVPATAEGIPAIRELIGEEINVNITLLFGLPRYREVVDAYLAGLENLVDKKKSLNQVASVASFFLSRIDTLIDPLLEKMVKTNHPLADKAVWLQGQAAIASAKIAYAIYKEIFTTKRFVRLANKGARTQKLLWASTSTKNPAYTDTRYVDALIGPDTINTIPVDTLNAYRDHGGPKRTLDQEAHSAYYLLSQLSSVGIDLDEIAQQLEDEGVEKFVAASKNLMSSIRKKQAVVHGVG